MNIKLGNVSRPASAGTTPRGQQYYDWRVFVDATPDLLDRIDRVTYFLHPTFPNPVRTVDDPSTKFALDSSGWGEFKVRAQVHLKDGSTIEASHMLNLTQELDLNR